MPLVFGFHQAIEGVVWLSLQHAGLNSVERASAFAFCTIATLWPTIFPLSLFVRPQDRIRKRLLACLLATGVATTGYLLFFLIRDGVSASVYCHSIKYEVVLPHRTVLASMYMVVMTASGLVSRYWSIRLVGVSACLSYVVSVCFYPATFPSVWCFFAAWISFCIVIHLRWQKTNADGLRL